mgnify:CR=1 FL=1
MRLYEEYSSRIYATYLKYVAPEDIIGEIEGQADPASPLDVIIEALEDDAASGETPPRESE